MSSPTRQEPGSVEPRRLASLPPSTETVILRVDDDGIAWVFLDRRQAANARNQQMRSDLAALWRWIAASHEVLVVVLTGAGDRFFCAGMDLKEASHDETPEALRERMRRVRDIEILAALPQPTIASINGAARGGGLEMALACDIRVIADEASIGFPEVGHGLMPGGGGTVRLPRLIGAERALEMLYLGTIMSGPEAVAAGLASRHVPADQLEAAVSELAASIAVRPPAAVRATKDAVRYGLEHSPRLSLDRELDGLLTLLEHRAQELSTKQSDGDRDGNMSR